MTAYGSPGELLLTYSGVVYPQHLDHMGHMNIQYYVAKFDEAVWNLFHTLGITASYIRGETRGMAALDMNIRYLHELFAGDVIAVYSGVLRVGETSLRVVQEMRNRETDEVAAIMRVVTVHMDRTLRRPVPFPPAIATRARDLILDYPEP